MYSIFIEKQYIIEIRENISFYKRNEFGRISLQYIFKIFIFTNVLILFILSFISKYRLEGTVNIAY